MYLSASIWYIALTFHAFVFFISSICSLKFKCKFNCQLIRSEMPRATHRFIAIELKWILKQVKLTGRLNNSALTLYKLMICLKLQLR